MRPHGRQWSPYDTLRFWIMQLALQLRIVPHASSILARSTSEERALMKVLMSLLSQFRRTFFVIDGLYKTYSQMLAILGRILEQDYGNVSVAVFHGEFNSPLESLTKFADVSIHVSAIEPNLQQYVHSKVIKLVGPALLDAVSQNSQANPSLGEIEEVIVEASDGL